MHTLLFVLLALTEIEERAIDLYIFGYPLVTMDKTREVMTNTVEPTENLAPMGQFANARVYPDPSMHEVTSPNADTLYSTAWMDVTKEPYVLHIPDENGRYFLMPMLDGWTEVFADPGKRTTGTSGNEFAITGPNWKGKLPIGVKEYKSPTNLVWIIGRTYCTGTPEDYKEVHRIQDQYTLTPLSSYGSKYTPPKGVFDPSIDMKTAVREQVNRMDAKTYFKKLAELMKSNPIKESDYEYLAEVPKLAWERIMSYKKEAGKVVNGWSIDLNMGRYGTDYLNRAYVTAIGLGANLPQDAVYPMTDVDSEGNRLVGEHRYVIHFPKGQTPPVKGFWSLTLYTDEMFFFPNPLNRYAISPRDLLKYNTDGSLDLYIQHATPGAEKELNWLPAPEGRFVLMLRLYWPEESVLKGTWSPPGVQKVVDHLETTRS